MRYFLALSLLLAAVSAQQGFFQNTPCNQSFQQLAFSGNLDFLIPYFFTFSAQPGQPGNCQDVGRVCPLYLAYMCPGTGNTSAFELLDTITANCGFLPLFGSCLPLDTGACPSVLADDLLAKYFEPNLYFQVTVGPSSACAKGPLVCPDGGAPFATLRAKCIDDLPRLQDDDAAVTVLTVVLVLCGLCGLASLLVVAERIRQWYARVQQDEAEADRSVAESLALIGDPAGPYDSVNRGSLQPQAPLLLPAAVLHYAKWFCLLTNLEKLLEVRSRNFGNINTLFFEGLRTLSMLFVIAGHTYFFPLTTLGYTNSTEGLGFFRSYTAITLYPAELAVDLFFFLSGFLFMHLYMKQIEKRHAKVMAAEQAIDTPSLPEPLTPLETLLMIVRRWLRIVPVIVAAMFTSEYLLRYVPTGPLARSFGTLTMFTSCRTNWWRQLLFVASYFDDDNCLGWFWYLNCDFQLFILGGVLAWVYYRSARVSAWAWWLLMLCLQVTAIALAAHYRPLMGATGKYYGYTYTRAAPYLYGIMAAVLVRYNAIHRLVAKLRPRFALYAVSLSLVIACINLMWYNDPINGRTTSDYRGFVSFLLPFGWGLAWLLLSLAWCPGHGGFFCRFLSHPVFVVASKLTFCAYIIHPIVMEIDIANQGAAFDFSVQLYYMRIGGYLVWSFIAGICLHLVVEQPFANMNDALTKRQ